MLCISSLDWHWAPTALWKPLLRATVLRAWRSPTGKCKGHRQSDPEPSLWPSASLVICYCYWAVSISRTLQHWVVHKISPKIIDLLLLWLIKIRRAVISFSLISGWICAILKCRKLHWFNSNITLPSYFFFLENKLLIMYEVYNASASWILGNRSKEPYVTRSAYCRSAQNSSQTWSLWPLFVGVL